MPYKTVEYAIYNDTSSIFPYNDAEVYFSVKQKPDVMLLGLAYTYGGEYYIMDIRSKRVFEKEYIAKWCYITNIFEEK